MHEGPIAEIDAVVVVELALAIDGEVEPRVRSSPAVMAITDQRTEDDAGAALDRRCARTSERPEGVFGRAASPRWLSRPATEHEGTIPSARAHEARDCVEGRFVAEAPLERGERPDGRRVVGRVESDRQLVERADPGFVVAARA